jgi:hypothetical protein
VGDGHHRTRTALTAVGTELELLTQAVRAFDETVAHQFAWPAEVNGYCLAMREKRQGIDLVEDQAEVELVRERALLAEVGDRLKGFQRRSHKHLAELHRQKQLLVEDLTRKRDAKAVDGSMYGLALNGKLRWAPHQIAARPKSAVEVLDWAKHNALLLAKAGDVCEQSKDVRHALAEASGAAANEVKRQEQAAGEALRVRLAQLKEAQKLDARLLNQMRYELDSARRERRTIRRDVGLQQTVLRRASTRLDTRSDRAGVEKTRDTVHVALIESVAEIDQAVLAMLQNVDSVTSTIDRIENNVALLQQDKTIKAASIKIEELCLQKRSYFEKMKNQRERKQEKAQGVGGNAGWEGTGIGMA